MRGCIRSLDVDGSISGNVLLYYPIQKVRFIRKGNMRGHVNKYCEHLHIFDSARLEA